MWNENWIEHIISKKCRYLSKPNVLNQKSESRYCYSTCYGNCETEIKVPVEMHKHSFYTYQSRLRIVIRFKEMPSITG